jgi:uncharacterized membrane protein YkoI
MVDLVRRRMDTKEFEMSSRFRIPALIGSVALLMIAVAAVVFVSDEIALGRENDDRVVVDGGQQLQDATETTIDEAIAIALAEVPGRVDGVEVERRGDRVVYDVEIDDTDVIVDATTGDVLSVRADNDDDNDRRVSTPDTADTYAGVISVDEAIEAARTVASGTVHDIELEHEDGLLVYSIEIGNHEVEIDAHSADVVKVEVDD